MKKLCVTATKSKKIYFTDLNKKHITENKCFCKTVKPSLPNKLQSSERIKIAKEDDTLTTVWEVWKFDFLSENIDHPTLKVILKYRKHPSIIAAASKFTKEYFRINNLWSLQKMHSKNQYIR